MIFFSRYYCKLTFANCAKLDPRILSVSNLSWHLSKEQAARSNNVVDRRRVSPARDYVPASCQGAGQAGGQLGQPLAPDIWHLHGQGPNPGWDVGIHVGVKISPCEGKWGHPQPQDGQVGLQVQGREEVRLGCQHEIKN